jgi:2'-5' RNA ligase
MSGQRIFFALWPDAEVRARLQELSTRLPDESAQVYAPHDWHMTLAFIGTADAQYLQCVQQAAAKISGVPFILDITQVGYFAAPRIVWAGPAAAPAELLQLHHDLNKSLHACGYQPESRPYTPHITLLRKARPPAQAVEFETIRWRIERFCLAESHAPRDGRRYSILQEFLLNGTEPVKDYAKTDC